LLGGLWVKMLWSGSPKSAAAMTIPQPAPPAVLDSNNKPKASDNMGLLRDWEAEPLPAGVSRNLFQVNLDYYPMDAAHVVRDSRTVEDPTFWEKLAKSIDAQARPDPARRNRQGKRLCIYRRQLCQDRQGRHPNAGRARRRDLNDALPRSRRR